MGQFMNKSLSEVSKWVILEHTVKQPEASKLITRTLSYVVVLNLDTNRKIGSEVLVVYYLP